MDVHPHVTGSLESIELVSLFIESLLNGGLLVLYGIAVWILLIRSRRAAGKLRRVMFAIATFMLTLSLVHLGIDIQRIADAFTNHHIVAGGATAFFLEANRPSQVAKSVTLFAATMAGDAFVVYRLSVVWNHSWRIVTVPILLVVGYCVAAVGYVVTFIQTAPRALENSAQRRSPWLAAVFGLSLCINVMCTSMIALRIWWISRGARLHGPWHFLEIVVQSASLYLLALVALIATYLTQTRIQYLLFDITPPIIGIAFLLIILRVGLEPPSASAGAPRAAPRSGTLSSVLDEKSADARRHVRFVGTGPTASASEIEEQVRRSMSRPPPGPKT